MALRHKKPSAHLRFKLVSPVSSSGQNAVQLHGGMGMTEELNVGHYFKRLTIIDTLFGNADFHLKRFGAL